MIRRAWSLMWVARYTAKWEGLVQHAYLDTIAVPAVETIGYGHTGPDVHAGMYYSAARALRVLARDLRQASLAVRQGIHVPLTVRQRMALIDLAFNCGAGAVIGSTLAARLNAGDYKGAAECFLDWDHAGGVVVEGLRRRRQSERWMFLHPGKQVKHNPHRPRRTR